METNTDTFSDGLAAKEAKKWGIGGKCESCWQVFKSGEGAADRNDAEENLNELGGMGEFNLKV